MPQVGKQSTNQELTLLLAKEKTMSLLKNISVSVTDEGKSLFTKRECQVLEWIADGGMDKQIANALQISVSAVKSYHSRINEKLHLTEQTLNHRSAVVTSAIAYGFLDIHIKD